MGRNTSIEWTDASWNPISGCAAISPGCNHCYAETIAKRFAGTPGHHYEHGFELTLRPDKLLLPYSWRKPRRVFVNSMSDLFHKDIPPAFLDQVLSVMEACDWHQFQVLTKRSSLMRDYVRQRYAGRAAPGHIWLGVSVEDDARLSRVRHLQETPAVVRFISAEPLLGPLGRFDLAGIGWVIVGGESGPGFRPMDPAWALALRDQCVAAAVPFFFKQWSAYAPKKAGRLLAGQEWSQMPVAAAGDA